MAESSACGAEKQSVWLTRMPCAGEILHRLEPVLGEGALDHHVRAPPAPAPCLPSPCRRSRWPPPPGSRRPARWSRSPPRAAGTAASPWRSARGWWCSRRPGPWPRLPSARSRWRCRGRSSCRLLRGSRAAAHARSMRMVVPARTFLNTVGSPTTRPNTLTGLAGRISAPRLAGVGPKKMQNAEPGRPVAEVAQLHRLLRASRAWPSRGCRSRSRRPRSRRRWRAAAHPRPPARCSSRRGRRRPSPTPP